MKIHIYLHDAAGEDVLHQINKKLNLLLEKEIEMAKTLDDILANVAENETLLSGLSTMISGLREQLAVALNDLSPEQQAKVDAIFAEIDKNQEKMIAAMATNVPPADPSLPV